MDVLSADLSDFLLKVLLSVRRKHKLRSTYILNSELLRGGMTSTECITRNCHNLYVVPNMPLLLSGLAQHHIPYSAAPITSWSPTLNQFPPLQPHNTPKRGSDATIVVIDALILYSLLNLISGVGLGKCTYNDACKAVAAQAAALAKHLFEQNPRLGHLILTSPPKECIALTCTTHCDIVTDRDSVYISKGPVICYETFSDILTRCNSIHSIKCYKTPLGPVHKAAYAIYVERRLQPLD